MMGMRHNLIPRWYSFLGDISVIAKVLAELLPDMPDRGGRGRPPKHPAKEYLGLIVTKELKKASLRDAETDWSHCICGERVDHAVIHYWEKHIPPEVVEQAVRTIGSALEEVLGYDFTVIDATAFADWHHGTTSFHVVTRIAQGTVYPVSMCHDTLDPIPNARDAIIPGSGLFMGDKWYDVNGVFRIVYKSGYTPLIKPQRTRGSGRWRRRGRRAFDMEWRTYRQRGRGESPFGSLTNAFGDRLHTRMDETTYTRCAARVIAYQIKIYIRATGKGIVSITLVIS